MPWLVGILATVLLFQTTSGQAAPPAQRNTLTFITGKPDPRANEQALRDVHVQLSIRDGKTEFRTGEAIRLVLAVTADRSGYWVDPLRYGPLPSSLEDVSVEPGDGVYRWLALYMQPDGVFRDVSSPRSLSDRPTEIVIALNWWVRFDGEGDYTVHTSTPISSLNTSGVRILSNAVTFHVSPRTDADEAAEVRRLRTKIDAKPAADERALDEPCEDLAFLAGDIATREKLDLALRGDVPNRSNCSRLLNQGLYISANPTLIASRWEQSLKDNAAPFVAYKLDQTASWRVWSEMPALLDKAHGDTAVLRRLKRDRASALVRDYSEDIASRLAERAPETRLRTALELSKRPGPMPEAVREILNAQFASLTSAEQQSLITRWQELDAVLMLPVVERALARPPKSPYDSDRSQALNALLGLAPGQGRAQLLAEILDQHSGIQPQGLRLAKPCVMPDIDRPLVSLLMALLASPPDESARDVRFAKALWLARCATGAAEAGVRRLYEDERLEMPVKANLLGYLVKWNEPESRALLAKAVAADLTGELLSRVTDIASSPTIDGLLRFQLESDDATIASHAASLLSQRGTADVRAALEARLARWMKDWGSRASGVEPGEGEGIFGPSQANLQTTLILCLIQSPSWKLSDAEAFALRKTCVTVSCREIVNAR